MDSPGQAGLVVPAFLLVGDVDPDLPGWLPPDVLLLSQGVLPRLLGRPPGLCRRRAAAAQELPGRKSLAALVPEYPPLFSVCGDRRAAFPSLGRPVRLLVAGRGGRQGR